MKPWHDNDEFWLMMEPAMFTPFRMQMTGSEIAEVVELAGIEPGVRVCDVCTGIGRHAVALAKRGFAVTGVDRTEAYLARARAAAKDSGVEVELVHADVREFVRPGAFDAAINMFSSFGYFADDDENRAVAANICTSLKPGRVAVFDLMGKEVLARVWQDNAWAEVAGGFLLEERTLVDGWRRVRSRWIMVRDGAQKEFTTEMRLYSGVELDELLRAAGFAEVELFGGLDGAPYDINARRLVAVARAPA